MRSFLQWCAPARSKVHRAIDPNFFRGKIIDALQPNGAQASEAAGVPQEKPGFIRRGLNAIKRGLGLGEKTDTSPLTPGPHPILDLITKAEGTKRGYDDSFAHQIGGTLTDKTLNEIESIQRGMKGSSAIGKYQFMRATLNGLRKELGLPRREIYAGITGPTCYAALSSANGASEARGRR